MSIGGGETRVQCASWVPLVINEAVVLSVSNS